MALNVDNTKPGEIQFVEIIISPYPVIGNCKLFSDVISITQPELCTTQNISQPMCTVSAGDDHSDNTGNQYSPVLQLPVQNIKITLFLKLTSAYY